MNDIEIDSQFYDDHLRYLLTWSHREYTLNDGAPYGPYPDDIPVS